VRLQGLEDLDAVHLGHDLVEQDHVRKRVSGHLERLEAILGKDNVESLVLENEFQRETHARVVLRHQDERLFGRQANDFSP
jgi:hypothetical protein